ncbi:MAG: methionyl-tRNA formyltransferase [Clostridia bacterium]|nr:methionyl-tRNA formyltransferase [Clostridia bacterium]
MKNDKINIVFFGTPEFALTSLENLYFDEKINISAVVTKPDALRGRKKILTESVVAAFAKSKNIPTLKPEKMKDENFLSELKSYKADFFVVVAYGKILPRQILDMPKYATINLHGSLLPEYRGAAPIQFALLNGDTETGVTTMILDDGMDTGDMLLKEEISVDIDDDYFSLSEKLANIGANLLNNTLKNFENIVPEKQNNEKATYTRIIEKKDGELDFNKSILENYNKIRALSMWPVAYMDFRGKTLKIFEADFEEKSNTVLGEIKMSKNTMEIGFKDGILIPKIVQLQGKKKMNISDFVNGNR